MTILAPYIFLGFCLIFIGYAIHFAVFIRRAKRFTILHERQLNEMVSNFATFGKEQRERMLAELSLMNKNVLDLEDKIDEVRLQLAFLRAETVNRVRLISSEVETVEPEEKKKRGWPAGKPRK